MAAILLSLWLALTPYSICLTCIEGSECRTWKDCGGCECVAGFCSVEDGL